MRFATSLLTALLVVPVVSAAEPLVIHEWGTFTSLQDEQGRTIGGLNVDEEFLPPFVHDLYPVMIGFNRDVPTTRTFKGISACNPTVTMRLETPVVYVHLPAGQTAATFDLSATFHGGFLSQFYPLAEPSVNGRPLRWQDVTTTTLIQGKQVSQTIRELQVLGPGQNGVTTWQRWQAPVLNAKTTSTLTWRGIRAGGALAAPATDSPIWLAPRAVDAANLAVGDEQERYLFYRGLAHLDAPLVARRSADGQSLRVTPRLGDLDPSTVPQLWLADLRGDGTAAFHTVDVAIHHLRSLDEPAFSDIAATFTANEYSAERLKLLRQELHTALVADGLFADEALALLATWEASYFKAPGQRLFFLVPREWTDRVLPLTTSIPTVVTRSMMGRIEVVSPAQRQALTTIATGPVSTTAWYDRFITEHVGYKDEKSDFIERPGGAKINRRLMTGESGVFASVQFALPPDYQAYLSLGRFRDALLWDAQRRTPDAEQVQFLRTYVVDEKVFAQDWQKAALAAKPTAARNAP
ncbi:MAG: hypothetical protein H0W78_16450 [Planctomycetes bacterium]|nr:hypothetical protein [Planctomycetota bacterium]